MSRAGGQVLSGVSVVALGRGLGAALSKALMGACPSWTYAARGPSLWAHGLAVASLGQGLGGLHGLVRRTVIELGEMPVTSCSVLLIDKAFPRSSLQAR